jgi:diguanylate cyclase (GGDEF)-like protein
VGLFDYLKEFRNQIKEVENNIYENKQDYLEIYEKNVQLEKEIAKRTEELDVANQRMLSLQHIWDMMNSSKPLSSVLNAIVKSFQGEIGYINSCIIKLNKDEKGNKYLSIISYDSSVLVERINLMGDISLQSMKLSIKPDDILYKSLKSRELKQVIDIKKGFKEVLPDLSDTVVDKILKNIRTKSIMVMPLLPQQMEFGWLLVFSTREDTYESEIRFLNLFAKQVELAITITNLFQVVKNQAVTDGLTGLHNRRYFEEFLQKEVIRANRLKQAFTIISLDLDHLKEINDKYGHSYGDIAITAVADVLKANARAIDVVSRIGGEEFSIILPSVDSAGGMIAAERIRKAIENTKLDKIGKITASIGVATFFKHSDNADELLELADQAMYMSKRNGRNRVTLAKPISEISWQDIAFNSFIEILSKRKIPIPKDLAKKLSNKLILTQAAEKVSMDSLYSVVDILASTYNPLIEKGVTKSKLLLATNLAKRFEFSKEDLDKLRIAILLYDIGNTMVPQNLFQKQSKLTEEEINKIQQHPIFAAREILKPITQIQDVIPIIEKHHENWDGSGYPNKISGEDIPLASQIILITDAYFALTAPRSYRPALSPEEALNTIREEADKKWNSRLVSEFISLVKTEL